MFSEGWIEFADKGVAKRVSAGNVASATKGKSVAVKSLLNMASCIFNYRFDEFAGGRDAQWKPHGWKEEVCLSLRHLVSQISSQIQVGPPD